MSTMRSSEPIDTFDSERQFQMWRYDVSHSQLLLRSVKSESSPSRIDVLFKAVVAIDLPTTLHGLRLRREGDEYSASGDTWSGRVGAGACFAAEDEGEYFDPSAFSDSLPGA